MGKNDAKQIDFARKHEEDLRRLRGLRLLDDDFMQKVFEDKACTELLLQIILKRADLKVLHVKGQQDIKNLQGRSITLDILAVDTDNKVYNIEIQRSDKGAAVKRARYNSSLIDSNVTEPGEKYEKTEKEKRRTGRKGSPKNKQKKEQGTNTIERSRSPCQVPM
ncbi:MAG: hypothetical protein V8T85_12540 [Blautia faecicola]